MPVIGLPAAFIAALVAILRGDERARRWTSRGFAVVALHSLGLTLGGVAHGTETVVGTVAGVVP